MGEEDHDLCWVFAKQILPNLHDLFNYLTVLFTSN